MNTSSQVIRFGVEAEKFYFDCLQKLEQRENALTNIKNLMIGSCRAKNNLVRMGLLPVILGFLKDSSSSDQVLIQVADCVGSIALPTAVSKYPLESSFNINPEITMSDDPMDISSFESPISRCKSFPNEENNCNQLVKSGFIEVLLSLLSHSTPKVITSSLCALKAIYSSPCAPHRPLKDIELDNISRLLSSGNFVECISLFLEKFCTTRYLPTSEILRLIPKDSDPRFPTYSALPKNILFRSSSYLSIRELQDQLHPNITPILLKNLVSDSATILSRITVLGALGQITFENRPIMEHLLDNSSNFCLVQFLLDIIKQNNVPLMVLHASQLITNISRERELKLSLFKEVQLIVIPSLLRLFDIPFEDNEGIIIQEQAALILARLIENDRVLQQTAMETGTFKNINQYLKDFNRPVLYKILANRLLVLASVTSQFIGGRKPIASSLSTIVLFLSHESPFVRAASCRIIQSLSRSLKQLRTSLVDEGVSTPIFKLLQESNIDVQICASSAICNLVLGFSATAKDIVNNGGIKQIVTLLTSPEAEVRCNGLWALNNLSYSAKECVKVSILKELNYDTWVALLQDKYKEIQIQTITLVRNITCKHPGLLMDDTQDIPYKLPCRDILKEKLSLQDDEMTRQCLFVICNICAEPSRISFCMEKDLLSAIRSTLDHQEESVRGVALLCIINLTQPTTHAIKPLLQEMGIPDILTSMLLRENGSIKERVATCLAKYAISSNNE